MQAFNNWIDEQFEDSPQPALSIYPEGHRSTDGASLPLKRGMLHYAFSRGLPVQCVLSSNKEAIIAEKHCTARWCQTAAVGYSGARLLAMWARVAWVWLRSSAALTARCCWLVCPPPRGRGPQEVLRL